MRLCGGAILSSNSIPIENGVCMDFGRICDMVWQLAVAIKEPGSILLNRFNGQVLFWQHTVNQSRWCQQKTTPKSIVIKTFQHIWATMQIQGNLALSALDIGLTQLSTEYSRDKKRAREKNARPFLRLTLKIARHFKFSVRCVNVLSGGRMAHMCVFW